MALNLFKFLLRCMRFYNYRSRPARQRTDRLAAIREEWEMFNNNLRNIYVPNEALTVDEQLVGYIFLYDVAVVECASCFLPKAYLREQCY